MMTPADEAAYRTILERTSDEDRYYRFFKAASMLDPNDVLRFVEARPDMLGWIAVSSEGEPLGAAHAALLDDGSAELAIVVAEGARERGVGKALLTALITYLQSNGIERVIAHSLRENVGFTHLAHSLGMHVEHTAGADLSWVCAPSRGIVSKAQPAQRPRLPFGRSTTNEAFPAA